MVRLSGYFAKTIEKEPKLESAKKAGAEQFQVTPPKLLTKSRQRAQKATKSRKIGNKKLFTNVKSLEPVIGIEPTTY